MNCMGKGIGGKTDPSCIKWKRMKTLADQGVKIKVTPQDEQIWITTEAGTVYVNDTTPFIIISEGRLEDGHIFYGIYGRVIDGPERYHGLVCSLLTRLDADDWRIRRASQANFKVGKQPVHRDHKFSFTHPEGTQINGYPVIGRFGRIEVIE